MRSNWKGIFQHFSLLKAKFYYPEYAVFSYSRASYLDSFVNQGVYYVYNGKLFSNFTMTPEHLSHRLGEFARTRAFFKPKIKKKKAKAKPKKKVQQKKKK